MQDLCYIYGIKKIRYQKEIEIFDKIKYLMKAPEKALHLLNNDNIFEAVNIIQKAMEILNEEQMNEIESLFNFCIRQYDTNE